MIEGFSEIMTCGQIAYEMVKKEEKPPVKIERGKKHQDYNFHLFKGVETWG